MVVVNVCQYFDVDRVASFKTVRILPIKRLPVSGISSLLNILLLVWLATCVGSFPKARFDDFACNSKDPKCEEQFNTRPGLEWDAFYRIQAYFILLGLLTVDILVLFNVVPTLTQYCALVFGYSNIEHKRCYSFLLIAVPFVHIVLLTHTPVELPCGSCHMKQSIIWSRIRTLSVLLFISFYSVVADAANNGYFVLRTSTIHQAALVLLRNQSGAFHESGAESGKITMRNDIESGI
jgi:hypothetical protein